jgi:hypothetical protein
MWFASFAVGNLGSSSRLLILRKHIYIFSDPSNQMSLAHTQTRVAVSLPIHLENLNDPL